MGGKKRKNSRDIKRKQKELLKKIKKDQFTAWSQTDGKAQAKLLFCLTSPSRRWFGDENGKSQPLIRGEWGPWGMKSLEEDISALGEVRSPGPEMLSWGQGREKIGEFAKEIA